MVLNKRVRWRNVLAGRAPMPLTAHAVLPSKPIRQRFEGMGINARQGAIAAAQPIQTRKESASYDAAFSQHQDLNWQLATVPTENGQGVEQRMIAAIRKNGAIPTRRRLHSVPAWWIQSFRLGGLYRENPNAPNGIEIIREAALCGWRRRWRLSSAYA